MDDDELTPAPTEELRVLLESTLARTLEERSGATEDAKPVDLGLSIGRLSRVDALQQQHLASARQERAQHRVTLLRSALERVEAGTYGECVVCNEPIGYRRLVARPEATRCHACEVRASSGR